MQAFILIYLFIEFSDILENFSLGSYTKKKENYFFYYFGIYIILLKSVWEWIPKYWNSSNCRNQQKIKPSKQSYEIPRGQNHGNHTQYPPRSKSLQNSQSPLYVIPKHRRNTQSSKFSMVEIPNDWNSEGLKSPKIASANFLVSGFFLECGNFDHWGWFRPLRFWRFWFWAFRPLGIFICGFRTYSRSPQKA